MDALFNHSSMIKAEALRLGFDGCGISQAQYLVEDAQRLTSWLGRHFHGGMAYMQDHAEKRVDPTKLVEGAKSVISVILNYFPDRGQADREAPEIGRAHV